MVFHLGIDDEELRLFTDEGEGEGPDLDHLLFDLQGGATSYWNQEIFRKLLEYVRERKGDTFPLDDYLMRAILNRYDKLMGAWKKGQAKITIHGSEEDSGDVEERLVDEDERLRKTKRRRNRRVNVSCKILKHTRADQPFQRFERRCFVVSRNIEMLQNQGILEDHPGLIAWRSLEAILDVMGKDGMSSDDSAAEDGKRNLRLFRARKMPWRAEICAHLDWIDGHRLDDETFLNARGAHPVERRRGDNHLNSRRDPPSGKPKNVYNLTWLEGKDEMYKKFVLKASDLEFEWVALSLKEINRDTP